tara:strand:+ start:685 stop:1368 length:684 start_codon:yes stop_codon:yes gene_type:complete
MLIREPLNTRLDSILNYIEDEENDYVENYEEISKTFNPKVSLETQAILNCCELLIDNYLPEKERILADIGCGAGFVLNPLKAQVKVAVDISLNQLSRVNKDSVRIRSNVENLPIESGYFNIIICTDIFEHVQDENLLVDELIRILKPGGLLLFACPWKQDLSVYDLPEYKARFKQYKYVHLRSIDEKTIEEQFEEHFERVSETFITVAMESMLFKPYGIKFFQFKKR